MDVPLRIIKKQELLIQFLFFCEQISFSGNLIYRVVLKIGSLIYRVGELREK